MVFPITNLPPQAINRICAGPFELPKQLLTMPIYGGDLGVNDIQLQSLNEAHALTESLYTINVLSGVSRGSKKIVAEHRHDIIGKIVAIMSALQDGQGGAECLRDCVDRGYYLDVFEFIFPINLQHYLTTLLTQCAMRGLKEQSFIMP